MATTYDDRLSKISLTMKYADKTRFTYSGLVLAAADDKLLDVSEALSDLQTPDCMEVIKTETSVISRKEEA